jgi:hypothetical protein
LVADPPAPQELEVAVFGRGHGESVLVHVGERRWVVVDSFRDKAKRPVAESYLDALDGEHRVVAVVLTHWDDDHTKGAADLIDRYRPEEVWIPAVLDNDEAFEFAYAHVEAERSRPTPSGLREFVSVTSGLAPGVTRYAVPGRNVATGTGATIDVLSPHDEIVRRGFAALGITQRPGFGEVSSPKPNETSIVLWVTWNDGRVLLGADLENSQWGWNAVLAQGPARHGPARLIKVPHHGSPDAHNDEVFSRLCSEDVWSATTRYTPGVTPRPSTEDRDRLRVLSDMGWVCGAEGPSKRDAQDLEELHELQLAEDGLWPFHGEIGLLRVRYVPAAGWTATRWGVVEDL